MSRARAAVGSIVFLVVAPGVVAGLVPWLLTGWSTHDWWLPVRLLGGALIGAGLAVLLRAFVRFAAEGVGTPAPIAPTERLVIGGAYRYVRLPARGSGVVAPTDALGAGAVTAQLSSARRPSRKRRSTGFSARASARS